MKISLRRLPQSRIRSTAPSRREPCDVRSSTDKKSCPLFSGGPRPSPTGLCVDFELYLFPNSPINPNLKASPNIRSLSHPKKNGPHKERPREERSLPSANTGRAPSGMGGLCSHPPHWAPKKPFSKRFLRSFFLKKATPAPAGAPRAAAPFTC